MKNYIFFLFIPIFSFSQKNVFSFFEKKVVQKNKIELIDKNNLFIETRKYCHEYNHQFYDNIHIIDINGDNKTDIIYQGPNGGESDDVIFLLNTGNKYNRVFESAGHILELVRDSTTKCLNFLLHEYPCCADDENFYKEYVCEKANNGIAYKLKSVCGWIDGMSFPSKIDSSGKVKFETILDVYNLRLTPFIDDEIHQVMGDTIKGNIIAQYPKGSIGMKVADSVDKQGKVWWFVKMQNNKIPKNNRLVNPTGENYYWSYGWMSSVFLRKMN
jgi:hypothetical protein